MHILHRLRFFSFIALIFIAISTAVAQQNTDAGNIPPSMQPSIPPTPQATALTRLAEFKSVNWTGTPDIGIHLFDFDCDGYVIPLRLSYEAQPMKPGHEFDTYGRGWALSGGSCVSRTIRGLPDEIRNFEINEDHLGVVINLKNYREFCDKMRDKDNYNYQSDLFNVVLPNGRSIDFVIQGDKYKNLTYKLSDADKDVKIKCNYITTSINSFVITDESGIIYEFMIADKASNGYLQDRLYNNVTWLLTKVILTNGRTINYEYNDVEQIKHDEYNDLPIRTFNEPCITFGYVFYVPDEQKEAPYWTKFTTTKNCPIYYEHLLNRIRFGNANINFNYSQASTTNDLITDIVIADGYGASRDVVRKIEFDVNTSLRQLRKLSILGTGRDTLNYSFKYSSQNPGTCTDHWGNYCGGTSTDVGNFNFFIHKVWGGNYVPEQYFPHYVHSLMTMMDKTEEDKAKNDYTYKFKLQHASWNYDSRSPSSPNCHGVLTSITYPNGGHTVFDYENHSFLTASMEDGSMEFERRRQRVVDGGGFRIKSISNYSADGALTDNYEYCYGPTYGEIRESKFPFPNDSLKSDFQHTGCGEAVVDPNLLTYMNYDLTAATPQCFKEMLLGIRVDRNQPNFTNYIASDAWGIVDWWYECRFSAQNFRNLLGGRPAVVYPEITVYHGKMIGNTDPLSVSNSIIGKTVYKFDVYSYTSRQTYQNQFYHKWAPDTTYFERVYYLENALHAEEHKARRNRLLSVTEYGRDRITDKDMFRELSKEKYEYKDNENTFSSGFVYNNRYNLEHQISPQGAFDYYISQGEQENQYQNPYSRPSSKPENYMPHSPSDAVRSWYQEMSIGELYSRVSDHIGHSQMTYKDITKFVGESYSYSYFSTSERFDYTLGDNIKSHEFDDKGVRKYVQQKYIYDSNDTAKVMKDLKSLNMYTTPCSGTTTVSSPYYSTSHTTGYKIDYAEYPSGKSRLILPSVYKTLYNQKYEDELRVIAYAKYGKPQIVENIKTGVYTFYLWGYDYRYPIAEIVSKTDPGNLIANIQTRVEENQFAYGESFDKDMRSMFSDSQVKTYTYRPLIGVTSMTDETGNTVYYDYDGLGQLTEVYTYKNGKKEILNRYSYDYPNK